MIWLGLAIAALCAASFVLAGLRYRGGAPGAAAEVDVNRALYREKLAELDAQHAAGDFTDGERDALALEYQRQFLVDNAGLADTATGRERGRWVFLLLAVLLPLFAAGVYLRIGAADELALRDLLDRRMALLGGAAPGEAVQALDAEILADLHRLARSKSDRPVYPVLLARLYQDRGDFAAAVDHYRAAVALLPEDGALHGEYAQALFFAAGNRMTAEVEAATVKAHSLNPDDQTALGLMGIAAYQASRYREAIGHWRQALGQLHPGSPSRTALLAGIQSAEAKLKAAGEDPGADGGVSLMVDVELDAGFEVPADTTVFIYARAWQGSPMPLAIKRLTRGELPARITLDESLAMNPAMTLASVPEVEVVARVSFAGTAAAAPGDIEGSLGPVKPGADAEPLSLVMARRIP